MGYAGNEFVVWLVIGLIIITAGVVIFNSQIYFAPYGYSSYSRGAGYASPYSGYSLVSADTGRSMFVGSLVTQTTVVESKGTFDVSARSNEMIVQDRVFNGAVFGDNSIKINGYIRDLQLDVMGTNGYGNLVVTADNGKVKKEVLNKELGLGRYIIPLENDGTVEIGTTSSEWRIWAPSLYYIRAEANILEQKSWSAEFDAETNVTSADLKLYFTTHYGKIRIKINDRIVLERTVRSEEIIHLDRNDLEDKNRVTIDAWDGSSFTGRLDIAKNMKNSELGTVELSFFLNKIYYDSLRTKPGKITFDVSKISRKGNMVLKIRNAEGNVVLSRPLDLSNQNYIEYFTQSHVKPGLNTVIIESAGSVFYTRNLMVWLMD
ncbi:MAG: hypothetical protein HZB65_00785 [Candidatus Aenigmarchaeota archaeon]|nr:hypothetical protein [Candidatus Aenigmarchaeota archaeon]